MARRCFAPTNRIASLYASGWMPRTQASCNRRAGGAAANVALPDSTTELLQPGSVHRWGIGPHRADSKPELALSR